MSEPADAVHTSAVPTALPPAAPVAPRAAPLVGAFLADIGLAVFLMLAISLAGGIALGVWQLLSQGIPAAGAEPLPGQPGLLAQIVLVILSTGIIALTLYFLRQPASADERARSLAALRRPSTWGWTLAAGLVVFLGSALFSWLGRQAGIDPVPSNEAMVEEAAARWPVFLALFVVVLAPAYEELLFRRVLFGRFLRAGRPWLGLVLSSLAFALAHEMPFLSDNTLPAMLLLWLAYGGLGAAFAWVYWRTGTLWAAVSAHALNNGIALALHGFG
ncbi:CPBP family intramembrane glutamic endopeptidase [Pseudoxanthomonas sp. J35]|uniref:CPBP family intramembrane glutamic endopeptidase n=1 Tax=Pseudoxanthomonas sp. J35 TaxID=935852 RepID=UPI0004913860|nr:CPBP family intramembrane glutamic endopeptidase [Pseudoxanthomonas sp. J35]